MVGVIWLAVLAVLAVGALRTTRAFLDNLERAKKTGLPYVFGRKFFSAGRGGEGLRWLGATEMVAGLTRCSLPSCWICLYGSGRATRYTA